MGACSEPLTCERCKHYPAERLVVADFGNGHRAKRLECRHCASQDYVDSARSGFAIQVMVFSVELMRTGMPVSVPDEAAVKAGEDGGRD